MELTNELLNRDRPLVIAHRGNKTIYPENTLFALTDAVKLGVDILEVDTRLTCDRKLVIFHDETLERTTNGKGNVSDKSLEEIKQLDAGYQFAADDGLTFPYREKGLQILTLQEAFEQFPETTFNIDIKNLEALAIDVLASLIKENHREDTVLVASFHDIQIQRFRKKMPTVKTAAGPSEVKRFLYATRFYLTWAIRPKYNVFQVPLIIQQKRKSLRIVEIVTPRFIKQAHSKGIPVMV
ncbi:MAG: glycerophosphodiester phosphodiesterase, partial [Candidatus Hodarchaeales archaeon]